MSPVVVSDGGTSVVVGALEGLTLNGLSLNNGTTHVLTALQLPIPAKKPEWVEGADANGAILMRDPLVENGTMVITVDLFGTSKDQVNGLIGQIVDELEEADRNPAGVPVVWTPAGGSQSLTFYALEGEVTQLESDLKFVISNVPTVQITLKCRPGGYGDLVAGPSQTTAGPLATLAIPDVLGDMPTDEAYIAITDQSSQSRWHVEWGAEWLHYNASTSLIIDSDSLVTSGHAGTSTTFAGSYDPNATGSNAIVAILFPSPVTLAGTGSLAHIGTFRVRMRGFISPITTTGYFRLAWRVGDGAYTHNAWVTPPVLGQYCEMDLGLVTVPPTTAGTQSWEGRIEAYSPSAAGTASGAVDYLLLVPAEAGYGLARGETTAPAGVISAYDTFAQSAGALNGKPAASGGTWVTSGAATDFQVTGLGKMARTEDSEGGAGTTPQWVGRYAVLGSTDFTATTVEVDITQQTQTVRANSGLLLRWVDASNWLAMTASLVYTPGVPYYVITISRSIAGVKTQTARVSGVNLAYGMATVHLTGSAASNGAVSFTATVSGGPTFTVAGTDTTLATGGALASGKPGLYNEILDPVTSTVTFENFMVSTNPSLVPAMYSGRALEVTASETRRQSSTGTMYGRPPSYRGSRFILNPEGSAGRVTRVAAKAHRNNIDFAVANQVTDTLKLQVFYRPRFSVVPR